jgi:D-alanyl-D-alanine carboxypeptidase/D-alanyl-D-alanine-endopeptidase (penicillin-binding protein 4)
VTDPQQPTSRRAARDAAQSATGSGRTRAAARGGAGEQATGGAPNRRRIILISSAAAVAFVLLGTGAVFAGEAAGKGATPSSATSGSTSAAPTRTVPSDHVAALSIPTCSISKLASASSLKKLYGAVVDIDSGDVPYSSLDSDAQPPASGEKILTAAAAIADLGPSFRITTKVVDGVTPGSITLVGEGDATLSRKPAGQSVYAGAPTISSLASATLASYNKAHPGVPITQVVLDSSYWDPSDNWDSSVPTSERTGGFLSETTALQVDGDRADPKAQTSPRGTDPVQRAGNAFVAALGALGQTGITTITGEAENGAPTLASVKSQPVSTLVKQMLLQSDNTLAEMLARIISVREDLNGTSSSLTQAIPMALSKYGISTDGLSIEDGSGESPENAVTPLYMAQLLALVRGGKQDLQYVAAGMSLAGKTGSLASRFTGDNSAAVGKIYGKSGSIDGAYTLSGYFTAPDGTTEAFAFFAVGEGISSSAQTALDSLATAAYKCGNNLSNN